MGSHETSLRERFMMDMHDTHLVGNSQYLHEYETPQVVELYSREVVKPQLLSPVLMILHVTYVLFHYGLMIICMIVDLCSFA